MAVTFVITLVVTALITYIITSLYYKHLIDHTKTSVSSQDDPHASTNSSENHDPPCTTDIPLDTNQTNGAATAPDNNPAYIVTTL